MPQLDFYISGLEYWAGRRFENQYKFLTYKRMEDLYNQTDKPEYLPIHLKYLFQDVTKVKLFVATR